MESEKIFGVENLNLGEGELGKKIRSRSDGWE